MGEGHTVRDNKLLHLNLAGCPESGERFSCGYDPSQPDMLRAGIYLGAGPARPEPAANITIEGNTISGHGMSKHCIAAAPGIDLDQQAIKGNTCQN